MKIVKVYNYLREYSIYKEEGGTMKKMDFVLFTVRSILLGLVFSLIFVGSVSAQMALVSSSPVDGATSVDTAGTLSLTFNQPIDVTANFEGLDTEEGFFLGLWLYPLGKLSEPDSVTFSSDFKTVYFHNVHLWPDTKYLVLLLGARSTSGDSLDKPYVINFTTGTSLPTNTVSGIVAYPGGDPTNTIVALLSLEMGESGPNFLASTVVSSASGLYTIPYVEAGNYACAAILDANHNGNLDIATDPMGWYDTDFNGIPDTLKVTGNMTGINIAIGTVVLQTAQGLLVGVDATVKSTAPDAELVVILGDELNLSGKALQWNYLYFSNSANKLYIVSTLGASILGMAEEETSFQIEPLPANWIDSDSALVIAEANGGSNFRTTYPDADINALLFPASAAGLFSVDEASYSKGRLCWKSNSKNLMKAGLSLKGQALWAIEYNSETMRKDTIIYLDAVTGIVTGVESEKNKTIPSSFKLQQNYPNPFNPRTTIRYDVSKRAHIQLRVLDLLGREVAVLVNATKNPGSYSVTWDGRDVSGKTVTSGIYLYELKTDSFRQVRRMIFLK